MRRQIILLALLMISGARTTSAQAVSIGVKGGIALTDSTGNRDESRLYLVGPSIEVRLPARFAIESGFLYQRIGNATVYPAPITTIGNPSPINLLVTRQRGNSFEFPVLGKYYFTPRTKGWQPFVGNGYAFRTIDVQSDYSETSTDSAGVVHTNSFHNNSGAGLNVGAVFAGGVRFHAGRLALSPELRYTRWGGSGNNLTRKNEAGLLLGVTF